MVHVVTPALVVVLLIRVMVIILVMVVKVVVLILVRVVIVIPIVIMVLVIVGVVVSLVIGCRWVLVDSQKCRREGRRRRATTSWKGVRFEERRTGDVSRPRRLPRWM